MKMKITLLMTAFALSSVWVYGQGGALGNFRTATPLPLGWTGGTTPGSLEISELANVLNSAIYLLAYKVVLKILPVVLMRMLLKACKLFGVTLEEFFEGVNVPKVVIRKKK